MQFFDFAVLNEVLLPINGRIMHQATQSIAPATCSDQLNRVVFGVGQRMLRPLPRRAREDGDHVGCLGGLFEAVAGAPAVFDGLPLDVGAGVCHGVLSGHGVVEGLLEGDFALVGKRSIRRNPLVRARLSR